MTALARRVLAGLFLPTLTAVPLSGQSAVPAAPIPVKIVVVTMFETRRGRGGVLGL
ncbi:MAG: hypothetical protein LAP86_12780 [Acidobacteriia bacterium]|nr:hypothetical protein [Terriglobia bacterium]